MTGARLFVRTQTDLIRHEVTDMNKERFEKGIEKRAMMMMKIIIMIIIALTHACSICLCMISRELKFCGWNI